MGWIWAFQVYKCNVYGKWKVCEGMLKYETKMLCLGYIETTLNTTEKQQAEDACVKEEWRLLGVSCNTEKFYLG